jgi:hypothetical protein
MVIGRSEDRDNPWDRLVLRHHCSVWNPIRVTHLGQRSTDRTAKAGHMTATDQTVAAAQPDLLIPLITAAVPQPSNSMLGCASTTPQDCPE